MSGLVPGVAVRLATHVAADPLVTRDTPGIRTDMARGLYALRCAGLARVIDARPHALTALGEWQALEGFARVVCQVVEGGNAFIDGRGDWFALAAAEEYTGEDGQEVLHGGTTAVLSKNRNPMRHCRTIVKHAHGKLPDAYARVPGPWRV